MIRVWFGAWFSTIYRVIKDLKERNSKIKFYVIGTNTNYEAVYREICDEWYEEIDTLDPNKYIDWALEFCKIHNVDIFIPRKNNLEISKRKKEFNDIGTKVIVEDKYEMMKIFLNKERTMEYFKDNEICNVADYEVVKDSNEFEKKYNRIKKDNPNKKICMKYITGEGGKSFRIIEEEVGDISDLGKEEDYTINYNLLIQMLRNTKKFEPIILMVYLTGIEISADCFQTQDQLIIIPRYKTGVRKETIKYEENVIEVIKEFNKIAKLEYPFNIQFRFDDNSNLYILEVNPRISGGIYLSNKSGYNILYNAICKIMGWPLEKFKNKKIIDIGYIEEGIRVNEK